MAGLIKKQILKHLSRSARASGVGAQCASALARPEGRLQPWGRRELVAVREPTLELPGLAGAGGRGPDLPAPAAYGSGLKSRLPGRVLPQPARGAAWRTTGGGSALRSFPHAASGGVSETGLGGPAQRLGMVYVAG